MLLKFIKVLQKHMNIVMIASDRIFYVLYCIYASVSVKALQVSNLCIHTVQLICRL
jgi:hypothetical protein